MFTLISLLFTCMLTHGVAPSGLLLSTMIHVPKNKRGSKSDSSNYRAIAISSILVKKIVFDYNWRKRKDGLLKEHLGYQNIAETRLSSNF